MTEIAVPSTNQKKMQKMAESGNKRAEVLVGISEVPEKFLATIQVGVTLSGFLASAVAADQFVGMLLPYFAWSPLHQELVEGILLIGVTIILAYFTLILGELVPKCMAMCQGKRLLCR